MDASPKPVVWIPRLPDKLLSGEAEQGLPVLRKLKALDLLRAQNTGRLEGAD